MRNNTAILDTINKTLSLKFKGLRFKIDLTQGDLHDNWNVITLPNGICYDTCFEWVRELDNVPSLVVYRCPDENQQYDDSQIIEIIETIGNKKQYFNY